MFVGLHALLAVRMNRPEMVISEDEGAQFMSAAQNVMRHYNVKTNQKVVDWVAFAGVAAGIYVPRIAAIAMNNRRGALPPQAGAQPNGAGEEPEITFPGDPTQFRMGDLN